MQNIDPWDDLTSKFQHLQFNDENNLDRHRRKAEMIIKNICGEDSKYLKDLESVSFHPSVFHSSMPQSDFVEAWESGKAQAVNLFSIIKEEKIQFGKERNKKTKKKLESPSTITLPWLFENASLKFWGWAGSYSLAVFCAGFGLAHLGPVKKVFELCKEDPFSNGVLATSAADIDYSLKQATDLHNTKIKNISDAILENEKIIPGNITLSEKYTREKVLVRLREDLKSENAEYAIILNRLKPISSQ